MNSAIEIGGNFSLTEQSPYSKESLERGTLHSLSSWNHKVRTSSGRGAISLLINNIQRLKRVLLPIYTCDSIIQPFRNQHISFDFYQINQDLSPDESSLSEMITKTRPDMVFLQSYYGFDTLKSVRHLFPVWRKQGISVVEDITHSLLNETHKEEVDYAVVSYRKWLEIPEGGALLSKNHQLQTTFLRIEDESIFQLFQDASQLKNQYLANGDEELKDVFRPMFYKIEHIYNAEVQPAKISKPSSDILDTAHWSDIKERRRNNFNLLAKNISNRNVMPVFKQLSQDITPLYLPIYVPGKRDLLQKHLAQQKIYCPIHWPVPDDLIPFLTKQSQYIYDNILSIVCDQRYNQNDMMRIVEAINQFE